MTVPLWTREFPAGATNETILGQAIDLPFLPSTGTLIFRFTTTQIICHAGGAYPQNTGFYSDTNIRIDNVRVE